jgi:hypothetical protein
MKVQESTVAMVPTTLCQFLVRKRGEHGHGIRHDRVGPMPPHVLYPDHFPQAPPLEPGTWQIIWSDVKGKRRVEFLFDEVEYKPASPV